MPRRERPRHPHRSGHRRPGAGARGRLIRAAGVLAAAILAAAALALLPVGAAAHAGLVSSDPAPGALLPAAPGGVTLDFSEPVTPAGPGITVLAPSGQLVSATRARATGRRLAVALRDGGGGTYLVRWQVIAADTHPSRGRFTFSVGHASPAPPAEAAAAGVAGVSPTGLLLQSLGRWLHLLGLALAAGVLAVRVLLLDRRPHPPAAGEESRRLDRLVVSGIALMIVAEAVALAGQVASVDLAAGDLLDSSFGIAAGLRLGGGLLLWAGLGAVGQAARGRPALLAIGAGIALTDGWTGHRMPGLADAAAIGLGALHQAAAAVWVGGLAAVLAVPRIASGFGRLGLGAFAILAASGAVMAAVHLRSPADVVGTAYGAVLGLKVLAVAVAAVIAGLGARRLEAVGLAGVLAVAALLVSLPPPR